MAAAAQFETTAVLKDETRKVLEFLRVNRGEFFMRSALTLTSETITALINGEPVDASVVVRIERWCDERIERVYR
jgi:hypothetical protein